MKAVVALFMAASATMAGAQSLSVADITSQIDAEMAALDEYSALLNNPDPRRALKAMEIMLGSGDPDLERLALDFGIYSTDAHVKRTAFETWVKTEPNLVFRFMAGKDRADEVARYIGVFNGTMSSDGVATTSYVLGAFDKDRGCYIWKGYSECAISVSDDAIMINFDSVWSELTISDDGKLVGEIQLNRNIAPVPVEVPISR
ncbi:hypothetical protein [Tropicibacter oceani]|uniref:Nuclear transport factor 2 family protein n=1 Tax=Tropicibacter oceani TaxID=3058420 RepID=A0ABY8QL26_9RHOB|nr:hypothetical protein [Tropicibacter oceani]WGW05330.1 hypothetical protein QF118_07220 [Tropicibacter oceani]